MAKVRIPAGYSLAKAAQELASIGVTLDPHPLQDGFYRAYIRKDKINQLLTFLTQSQNEKITLYDSHHDRHSVR